ncbi:hypothetical protein H6F98_22095 [Microcoleus sp. FACHB-SPT15]|uniref:hypothetical protein n=1 Tax=Microcoleus sp. FACHB-SPT15 TaxID=2692830 RepID=UPI00177D3824|nr:hypothetical protein [Microcoleus sp. FACHB-SPT15]MBD1808125.1 hypothetical protein [Microcoleus sp. FACHB-SPT15]
MAGTVATQVKAIAFTNHIQQLTAEGFRVRCSRICECRFRITKIYPTDGKDLVIEIVP